MGFDCFMKQKVVVIGHGYTSRLGVIRALGRVGYDVSAIIMLVNKRKGKPDMTPPVDSYSKYISSVYYCLPDTDSLISLLLEKCVDDSQKVILIPDSDFSAAAIDQNQEKLEKHFLFPHILHTPGAVVAWMSKLRQKETAIKVGLNVAAGDVIEVVDGKYSLTATIHYPCFPKPLMTLVGAKTGIGRCDSELELRKVIDLLMKRSSTISILVEEYKEIEDEYALLGVSDGKDVHIPGILHLTSLASGSHFGVAKRGEILPIEGYEGLLDRFKAFVREVGFVGIFDIDFYKSRGRYFFCEMNFRYGGSGYAYTKSGVNLPAIYAEIMQGKPMDASAFVREKAVYVNERMCLDDWYNGFISTREFKDLRKNCDISFIADEEDPKPEIVFRKLVRKQGGKRFLKKCLGQ